MNRTLRHGTSFQKTQGALCAGVARVLARGVALVLAASLATGLVPHRALAAPGDITTFAGGLGQGPGLNIAQTPSGMAVKGTLVYVADVNNHVVRRLDTTSGNETVVAGNGSFGFSGDGGLATAAQLYRTLWRRARWRGRPVHRRHLQLPHPAGRRGERGHHDGCGQRQLRLLRRRRPGDGGSAQLSPPALRSMARATCSSPIPSTGHPAGRRDERGHHHGCGHRHSGYCGDGGPATAAQLDVSQRRGAGWRGQPVHRRQAATSDPAGRRGERGHHDGGGHRHRRASAATADRRRRLSSPRTAWRWMPPATCSSPTRATSASGGSTRSAGSSPRWRATAASRLPGDGGLATAAQFDDPVGVALDGARQPVHRRPGQRRVRQGRRGERGHHHGCGQRQLPASAATAAWRRPLSSTIPSALRSMARATCSSPTTATTASGGSTRRAGSSRRSPATAAAGFTGDGGLATAASSTIPPALRGCRGQPVHRRHGQPAHPAGGRGHRGHHDGCGQRQPRLHRRRRPGHGGSAQRSRRRGGGCRGQPVHRRPGQQPHPAGRRGERDHHDGCGQRRLRRLLRRRRPGDGGSAQLSQRRCARWRGQPVHRRLRATAHPAGRRGERGHHDGCGQRQPRLLRRRRPGDGGSARLPLRRCARWRGRPVHREQQRQPHPAGRRGERGHRDGCRQWWLQRRLLQRRLLRRRRPGDGGSAQRSQRRCARWRG